MSKGNFEVSLPKPYLGGDIYAEVYEVGGARPTSIIRADQGWGVKIRWDLEGSLAPFICGEWCIHLRLESMGPGPEIKLDSPRRINLDPCGRGGYYLDFRVKPGIIKSAHCSIPYKPVVTVTYYTACHKPGPMAGFVELPILQFYEVDGRSPYGSNGKLVAEVDGNTDFEANDVFETEAEKEFAR